MELGKRGIEMKIEDKEAGIGVVAAGFEVAVDTKVAAFGRDGNAVPAERLGQDKFDSYSLEEIAEGTLAPGRAFGSRTLADNPVVADSAEMIEAAAGTGPAQQYCTREPSATATSTCWPRLAEPSRQPLDD